jgi:CRISPR type I-E-associated protein CasB/Cse2
MTEAAVLSPDPEGAADPEPETTAAPTRRFQPMARSLGRSFATLDQSGGLSRGTVAALRRMGRDLSAPPGGAFWAMVEGLIARGEMPETLLHGPLPRPSVERPLALALSGMALMAPHVHADGVRPGRRLVEVGFSERRLMALLAARDAAFEDLFSRLCRFLAQGAQGVDWTSLLQLVLGTEKERERARRAIARDYYVKVNHLAP